MKPDPQRSNPASNAKSSSDSSARKVGKARCPHCQTINPVEVTSSNQIFRCSQCEKDFRVRQKQAAIPPPPPAQPTVRRFAIQCHCKAKLMVTYAQFGKKVTCNSCHQLIKIPDWIAETKFTGDEFDDMFSPSERDAMQSK